MKKVICFVLAAALMLTLSLSGEDVFSAAARMTGDGLYLDSAILGDKPVYASAEDIGQVLTQLASADETMDAETVSQIKPMIAHLFSQAGMMSELKGMALATIVGVGLSLIFKLISVIRPEEVVLDADDSEKAPH